MPVELRLPFKRPNMSQQETRQSIYVEADALWDTRLGTLARIGDEVAEKTLFSGSYHSREIDSFELVDSEQYKTLYAQRDGQTLSKSMCTGVVYLLQQLTAALTEQAITRPYHTGPKIVVNLYPYSETLSGEEKDEIHKAIAAWVRLPTRDVELLSLSLEALTPGLVKASNTAAMFMYTPNDWMNAQASAFVQTRIPDVSLFGPATYEIAVPSQEDIEQQIRDLGMHPFHAMEMQASPLVNLQFLPVSYFSIITTREATGISAQPAAPSAQAEERQQAG